MTFLHAEQGDRSTPPPKADREGGFCASGAAESRDVPGFDVPDQHSRDNAGRMLDDPNYPTAYERARLMIWAEDAYARKTIGNLLAMLDEARDRLASQREGGLPGLKEDRTEPQVVPTGAREAWQTSIEDRKRAAEPIEEKRRKRIAEAEARRKTGSEAE